MFNVFRDATFLGSARDVDGAKFFAMFYLTDNERGIEWQDYGDRSVGCPLGGDGSLFLLLKGGL
jgi:hypothetical protein